MDWVSGRAVKVESERSQWWPVDPLQWRTMDLGWKLIVTYHLVGNLWANVIDIEGKTSDVPSGYMLVYKDQAMQDEGPQQDQKEDTAFLSRRQDSYQESLDVLHSPQAPPTQTLGNHQHQRGGAPHPLANRPRWDAPGRFKAGSHGWTDGEDLQRVDWGQGEAQRRVGLNLEPVLAPKNFTVAGQEVKDAIFHINVNDKVLKTFGQNPQNFWTKSAELSLS